jgi:hypothetical protein
LPCLVLILVTNSPAALAESSTPRRWTLELTLGNQQLEGMPLVWSADNVTLLGRDGRLWDFLPNQAKDFREKSPDFRSYTAGEMRMQLLGELGNRFEVTGTGHYLVAHPAGQRDLWGQRFEDLYRSFVHYFRARSCDVANPEFPLVAIVLPNQADFMRFAAAEGNPVGTGVLGYYSPTSNRIILYDTTAGQAANSDWTQNADTIIHEATHQTAFNTGIHSRYTFTPRWLGEGLGTLFEAPGVWNSRYKTAQSDRINRGRLDRFRQYVSGRRPAGALASLIATDRLFQYDADGAYAESWALTFYLTETQPRKYSEYLAKTAGRPVFATYSEAQRLQDFQAIFGADFRLLEAQFLRYLAGIK